MSGRLLDTNFVIRYLENHYGEIPWMSAASGVYVSHIVIGELLYGAELSAKKELNRKKYLDFCNELIALSIDESVLNCYAQIKADLKLKGRPIPENDIWIAAIALSNDLTLVTEDKHFDNVEGLIVECPLSGNKE